MLSSSWTLSVSIEPMTPPSNDALQTGEVLWTVQGGLPRRGGQDTDCTAQVLTRDVSALLQTCSEKSISDPLLFSFSLGWGIYMVLLDLLHCSSGARATVTACTCQFLSSFLSGMPDSVVSGEQDFPLPPLSSQRILDLLLCFVLHWSPPANEGNSVK